MARFSLKAADGRRVTNHTANGVSLTANPGLCYVWDSYEKADRERVVYELILGTRLTVEDAPAWPGRPGQAPRTE